MLNTSIRDAVHPHQRPRPSSAPTARGAAARTPARCGAARGCGRLGPVRGAVPTMRCTGRFVVAAIGPEAQSGPRESRPGGAAATGPAGEGGGQLKTAGQIAAVGLADPQIRREYERTALAHAAALRVIGYRTGHSLSQTALASLLGMHQPASRGWKPAITSRRWPPCPCSLGARPGVPSFTWA